MYDPRWNDSREGDDVRARVYDERDRADHDPRDGLMHDLDLPRGEARELVVDRDHLYELNGEDSRTLAVVGAFRVVPEGDLGSERHGAPDGDTLEHLRDEGLIRTIPLGTIAHLSLAPCSASSMLFAPLRPGRRPGLRALTTPARGTTWAIARWPAF